MPKDGEHHAFIACISVDSVMKMDKKNYAQVYLQECKYKIRKNSKFSNSKILILMILMLLILNNCVYLLSGAHF